MSVFSSLDYDQHENVVFYNDAESGLRAIIAIHNTQLGPAMGGCRMYPYASEQAAVLDVLRLSRGMTYKAALAGVSLGGGKSVIIGNPETDKSKALFEAMGRFIESLSGRYVAGQDMGIAGQDLTQMATQTSHVWGGVDLLDEHGNARTGDPSPATALGVFYGIKAAVKSKLRRNDLVGVKVAIQGLGSVGFQLARHLHEAGVRLWVSDINSEQELKAVDELGAQRVNGEEIFALDVDVFSPCAMGGIINDLTIPQLKVRIVAGAANNQLLESRHGKDLLQKDILYAPDYVINAGGLIDLYCFDSRRPATEVKSRLQNIAVTLSEIFAASARTGDDTSAIANAKAEALFSFSYAKAS